jgi:hypothetical protein
MSIFEWIIFIIDSDDTTNWDKLFEILSKFSPNNLFNFKFYSVNQIRLNSLKPNYFLIIEKLNINILCY